jgi:hypothetical protein
VHFLGSPMMGFSEEEEEEEEEESLGFRV